MDQSDSHQDLHRDAEERTLSAYADLAEAAVDLRTTGLSSLERSVLIALFVNDGFEDGFAADHHPTSLLQAVAVWPGRSVAEWEGLFGLLSATAAFQRYRLKRDILVARNSFSEALKAVQDDQKVSPSD
jgi:hypothetical protein